MDNLMKPLKDEHVTDYDIEKLEIYSFPELSHFKQSIEANLSSLVDDLHKQNISMDTSLLTLDGFPRNDIDVVDVRQKRVKIIQLKNDLDQILSQLMLKLNNQFKPLEQQQTTTQIPFLVVDDITQTSAALGKLQLKDKIVQFNELNASNYQNLQTIATNIRSNDEIRLTIKRDNAIKEVIVTHNKGSLGLKLTPL